MESLLKSGTLCECGHEKEDHYEYHKSEDGCTGVHVVWFSDFAEYMVACECYKFRLIPDARRQFPSIYCCSNFNFRPSGTRDELYCRDHQSVSVNTIRQSTLRRNLSAYAFRSESKLQSSSDDS